MTEKVEVKLVDADAVVEVLNRSRQKIEYLRALLGLVATASADDGHELREHLHPEIRGMVDKELG